MITAHVNEMGIVMRFDTVADNLSPKAWETLLDELKSHYIPSFYQHEKRMHVDFGGVKDGVPGLMRCPSVLWTRAPQCRRLWRGLSCRVGGKGALSATQTKRDKQDCHAMPTRIPARVTN